MRWLPGGMVSSRKQNQAHKRSARHKKRREVARNRRQSSTEGAGKSRAHSWPTGDCWIGADWFERGAEVAGIFVRRHSSGQCSAARVRVDLADEGLTEVEVRHELSQQAVLAWVGTLSDQESLVQARPELVVKLAHTGADITSTNGEKSPREWERALELFGDIDPEASSDTFLTGLPDTEEKPRDTWFNRTARWLFGT